MDDEMRDWSLYNLSKTREFHHLLPLITALVDSFDYPDAWNGRGRRRLPVRDLTILAIMKAYERSSNRTTVSKVLPHAHTLGMEDVPHFNSLGNFLGRREAYIIAAHLIMASSLPLAYVERDFSVDSTGFGLPNMEPWSHVRALKATRRKDYRKLHIIVGNLSHIVPVAVVTDGHKGDSPAFRAMARNLAPWIEAGIFSMDRLMGDPAFLARINCDIVEEMGGQPFFKPKKNSTPRAKTSSAWRRMILFHKKRKEEFMEIYYQRENVESAISSIKARCGGSVMAKTTIAQDAEIMYKVVVHNLLTLIRASYEIGLKAPQEIQEIEDSMNITGAAAVAVEVLT